ncbi:DMT family transporter [Alicycliphilus denitrificans]|uniref:DMT family transporter n=1 Tax=Alicycliphilus denitrificans TaxID=179636 RepID=UPI00384D6079
MQALWMVLAAFLFASMGVCIKLASAHFNAAELVFYRGLISMAVLWVLARRQGVSLSTRYPGMHAWRSLIGVTSLGCWFYVISQLPLPTAMTFNYMSSLWIAIFLVGGALLQWRPSAGQPRPPLQVPLVLCVLIGFGGILMMMRPSLEGSQGFAGIVGMVSGMTTALAFMQVVALSRLGEPEARTVFYFALGCAVAGGAALPLTGTSTWPGWPALWLLPLGLLAAGGQLCMTLAYARSPSARGTLVVANLQYTGLIFAAIYGITVFGDELPLISWLGMLLIVGSGIGATVLRARTAPDTPGEER